MADKILTQFTPIAADLKNIFIAYDAGNPSMLQVTVDVRTNDPEEPIKRKFLEVNANTLTAGQVTNLVNLATAVLTLVKNRFGF